MLQQKLVSFHRSIHFILLYTFRWFTMREQTDWIDGGGNDVKLMVTENLPQTKIFTRDANQHLQLLQRRTFLRLHLR